MEGVDERKWHKAPGRFERRGITLIELLDMFPDDAAVERWFAERRWPGGWPVCPACGSFDTMMASHRSMPYHCRERECRKRFSVRYGTVMEGSKLDYRVWAVTIYLMTTNIKGVSSMKLHCDLWITQKMAWFLAQRVREARAEANPVFSGPVEADETYMGGLEGNKHQHNRMKAAGDPVGKAIVAGVRDWETARVAAKVVSDTKAATLTGLVADHAEPGADVYTDEARGYLPLNRIGFDHRSVSHSTGQWVNEVAHTNGMESLWAMMKRGYHGVYHQMSHEHLHCYVSEFAGRHNQRPLDTADQMAAIARGMDRKRLIYEALIARGPHARQPMKEAVA